MKVTKSTRAPRMGRQIVCPECNTVATVYHFAWSGLQCQHCKQMIDKYDWSVVQCSSNKSYSAPDRTSSVSVTHS